MDSQWGHCGHPLYTDSKGNMSWCVFSVQLYVNLVKISKCNRTMCIFGESVGTSPKPFVLRYQMNSIVVCVLPSAKLGAWRNCVWGLSETRQLIHLLSVSGTWGIINSLMWMAALSHRFHASTRCKYFVFCGIGLGDLGGSSSSSWQLLTAIHVVFRKSLTALSSEEMRIPDRRFH